MWNDLERRFRALDARVDFCSLRAVEEESETLSVRQDVPEPISRRVERGAMITVIHRGGYGYAATADLSQAGLQAAFERARAWAEASAGRSVFDYGKAELTHPRGQYAGPGMDRPLDWNRKALMAQLMDESHACHLDERIVDWDASIGRLEVRQRYLTSGGGDVEQAFRAIIPSLSATAFADGDSQTRSLGGQYNGYCRQGGLEILADAGLAGAGRRVADEALQLLLAPNCPSGSMDLLLMPSQMMLQIHESIGHPLELDRILGDERNYAGTSFVTPDMFGHYQYGSPLLNVTYDPTLRNEFAAFGWDDDGRPAERTHLIRDGILQNPLGGSISQARAQAAGFGLGAVANSRACNWNRAPIDRMANLNVEPGDKTLDQLIAGIERGVMMDTNVSWSIDDSRNKFQFSCEWGRLIEDGQLKGVVKNAGYRGISATFWRALKAVGDRSTFDVMGTPFCGKGEPNQVVRVGHASPACVFGNVDVFGGSMMRHAQHEHFQQLADHVHARLQGGEGYTLWFAGEHTDFVRFNHGRVRQAGQVAQAYLTVRLIRGQKHLSHTVTLSGDTEDKALLDGVLGELRAMLADVPDDPHLLLADSVQSTTHIEPSRLPASEAMVADIVDAAEGDDLVGILAAGPVCHGFANHLGQRNWHETASWNFDWSLYSHGDKAVKRGAAGFDWQGASLTAAVAEARTQLALLARPMRTLAPGGYRAYLTPAALGEIMGTLQWSGAFSEKHHRTMRSPLLRLQAGEASLAASVTLREDTAQGLAPGFQEEGFIKPAQVSLIAGGRPAGSLVSPRTAKEYGLAANSGSESPVSLAMEGGSLPSRDVLRALGTGLYVSNLWYLNYSDRAAARMTGMTRFACFWVEGGEIVAPLGVMRFDDALYRMLGSELEALTLETEFMADAGSYGARSSSSQRLPGALLRDFRLVL